MAGRPMRAALLSALLALSCGPAIAEGSYDSTWTPAFGDALHIPMLLGEHTLIVQGVFCEVVQSDEEEMVSALCSMRQGSALLTLFGSPWPSHLVGNARLYGAPITWRYEIDAKVRR